MLQRWSFWQNNLLPRNPFLCAELFKNLLKRWVTFIICRTCCKLNSQYSSAESWSRRSKCVIWDQSLCFFVLFTYRQVTKSNCINLIDFGRDVKVLTTTKSLLYQHKAFFLTYYHGMYLKLMNSSRLHCYSRRSQWNRGLTAKIWSLGKSFSPKRTNQTKRNRINHVEVQL